MFQVSINFGILIAYLINYIVLPSSSSSSSSVWDWKFCLFWHLIPSLTLPLLCSIVPPSPRWLLTSKNNSNVSNNDDDDDDVVYDDVDELAYKSLKKVRSDQLDVKGELNRMMRSCERERKKRRRRRGGGSGSSEASLLSDNNRRSTVTSLTVLTLQVGTGIDMGQLSLTRERTELTHSLTH